MKKTYVVYSHDITDERFNKLITDNSDDKEVWFAYHLKVALLALLNQMFPCNERADVVFPMTMDVSVEALKENANAKLVVTASVDHSDKQKRRTKVQVNERELIQCGKALERALSALNRLFNLKEGVAFSDFDPLIIDRATWEDLGRGFIEVELDQTYGADAKDDR